VTTDVGNANSGGGTLIFGDGGVNPTITSGGVAGSGNLISTPVQINRNLDITGTNDLTINGGGTYGVYPFGGGRIITNNLPDGKTLFLDGKITLTDVTTYVPPVPGPEAATAQNLLIQGTGRTVINATIGHLVSSGQLQLGTTSNVPALTPTIVINGNNTYTNITVQNRSTVIVGHDNAFGLGEFRGGNPSNAFGFDLQSTDDARTIANNVRIVQNMTFSGEHSMTFTGFWYQSNGRSLVNLLPAGKTLTIGGGANSGLAAAFGGDAARVLSFDGSGTTNVTANVYNHRKPHFPGTGDDVDTQDDITATGHVMKNGTGLLNLSGTGSTYKGRTVVNGGLLQFDTAAAYGATSGITVNSGGAVGLLTGSTDAAFLGKIGTGPAASTGALALDDSDAAVNLDFSSGALAGANLVGMSVGASAPGVTYTGTITPAAAGYRLGGGGTLTLANTNALTGAANVTVTNGGTVALAAANDYSGATLVKGHYVVSVQEQAAAKNNNLIAPGVFVAPTLSVSDPASLGTSADDAGNLSISGGTLRYTGSGHSTNRLFTISPAGATLDASGTGAINFTNAGPVVVADVTGTITGNTTVSGNTINLVNDISQLAVGMTVSGGNLPAGTTITGFNVAAVAPGNTPSGVVDYRIRTSANATAAATGAALTFGAQNRTLTLTGSNTGANAIAGALGDATSGTLSIAKTGAGTWALNGALDYTGSTSVSAGTLELGSSHVGSSGVSVAAASTLRVASDGDKTLGTKSLTIAAGGKLDMTDNDMIVDWTGTSPEFALRDKVLLARDGDAEGIFFTGSDDDFSDKVLAFGEALELGFTEFNGVTVDDSTVLGKYTYYGDANFDGQVTTDDYVAVDLGLGTGDSWVQGDFDLNGVVTTDDYVVVDLNLGKGTDDPLAYADERAAMIALHTEMFGQSYVEKLTYASENGWVAASVPEPGAMSLVGLGAMAMLGRRKRR
jgi:autotransporter-associated beta strand protein